MEYLRLDYVFSYWIFLWFILYELKLVKYSPKFIIIIGIIENLGLFSYFIYKKSSFYNIAKFIIINIFIKIIPLYLVWKDKIIWNDIIASLVLFLIYLLWLVINNRSNYLFNEYNKLIKGYINQKYKNKQSFLGYSYDFIYRKIFE
jgi:hypothetical protein